MFLRPLSPYGFAIRTKSYTAYDADKWLDFYFQGLDYIIELNRNGLVFAESYAGIILSEDSHSVRDWLRGPEKPSWNRNRRLGV